MKHSRGARLVRASTVLDGFRKPRAGDSGVYSDSPEAKYNLGGSDMTDAQLPTFGSGTTPEPPYYAAIFAYQRTEGEDAYDAMSRPRSWAGSAGTSAIRYG